MWSLCHLKCLGTPHSDSAPKWPRTACGEGQGKLNSSHRQRLSHGIPESEQEAQKRLLGQQWLRTSVMRGCSLLCLQWIWGTSQWCLSFGSPPFRGHFCPLQWLFCALPAFFLPTFNPSSLLLFLPPLSVSTRKQNKVETTTVHSPLSPAVFHYDFSPSLCLCTLHFVPNSSYAAFVCEQQRRHLTEVGNNSSTPLHGLHKK